MTQLTLFETETIKDKTLRVLRSGWHSTTQMIMATGASSSDRRRRDLEREGYNILTRKRDDGIIQYKIEG